MKSLGWKVEFAGHAQFHDIPYNPIPSSTTSPILSSVSSAVSSLLPSSSSLNSTSTSTAQSHAPTNNGMVQKLEDPDIGNMKKPRLVSAVCERVKDAVKGNAENGWLSLTLGGDHSLVSEGGTRSWRYMDTWNLGVLGCLLCW